MLYKFHTIKDGLDNIYLAKLYDDRWYCYYSVIRYGEPYEEYIQLNVYTYTTQKHVTILREPKYHQKCSHCGHDVFIKSYN